MMRQVWEDLLFAHWPVEPAVLRPFIPTNLEIDSHNGRAWIGLVPFRMSGVGARVIPAEFSPFPELNVRTYVVHRGKPGVWFFSLDAAHALTVWGARKVFHLPYFFAAMTCEERDGWIHYRSQRHSADSESAKPVAAAPARFSARYRPVADVFQAQPGSLEYFLTERYCLYAPGPRGALLRCEIHHPPWPLQHAEAVFEENTMMNAAGLAVAALQSNYLHFSRRQRVVVWPPRRVRS
jgi:uncharacterized protein